MTLIAALICAALIFFSAFFVMAEFAAVRVRETQLEALAEEDLRARLALEVHSDLSYHLSAIQAGLVLCSAGPSSCCSAASPGLPWCSPSARA